MAENLLQPLPVLLLSSFAGEELFSRRRSSHPSPKADESTSGRCRALLLVVILQLKPKDSASLPITARQPQKGGTHGHLHHRRQRAHRRRVRPGLPPAPLRRPHRHLLRLAHPPPPRLLRSPTANPSTATASAPRSAKRSNSPPSKKTTPSPSSSPTTSSSASPSAKKTSPPRGRSLLRNRLSRRRRGVLDEHPLRHRASARVVDLRYCLAS